MFFNKLSNNKNIFLLFSLFFASLEGNFNYNEFFKDWGGFFLKAFVPPYLTFSVFYKLQKNDLSTKQKLTSFFGVHIIPSFTIQYYFLKKDCCLFDISCVSFVCCCFTWLLFLEPSIKKDSLLLKKEGTAINLICLFKHEEYKVFIENNDCDISSINEMIKKVVRVREGIQNVVEEARRINKIDAFYEKRLKDFIEKEEICKNKLAEYKNEHEDMASVKWLKKIDTISENSKMFLRDFMIKKNVMQSYKDMKKYKNIMMKFFKCFNNYIRAADQIQKNNKHRKLFNYIYVNYDFFKDIFLHLDVQGDDQLILFLKKFNNIYKKLENLDCHDNNFDKLMSFVGVEIEKCQTLHDLDNIEDLVICAKAKWFNLLTPKQLNTIINFLEAVKSINKDNIYQKIRSDNCINMIFLIKNHNNIDVIVKNAAKLLEPNDQILFLNEYERIKNIINEPFFDQNFDYKTSDKTFLILNCIKSIIKYSEKHQQTARNDLYCIFWHLSIDYDKGVNICENFKNIFSLLDKYDINIEVINRVCLYFLDRNTLVSIKEFKNNVFKSNVFVTLKSFSLTDEYCDENSDNEEFIDFIKKIIKIDTMRDKNENFECIKELFMQLIKNIFDQLHKQKIINFQFYNFLLKKYQRLLTTDGISLDDLIKNYFYPFIENNRKCINKFVDKHKDIFYKKNSLEEYNENFLKFLQQNQDFKKFSPIMNHGKIYCDDNYDLDGAQKKSFMQFITQNNIDDFIFKKCMKKAKNLQLQEKEKMLEMKKNNYQSYIDKAKNFINSNKYKGIFENIAVSINEEHSSTQKKSLIEIMFTIDNKNNDIVENNEKKIIKFIGFIKQIESCFFKPIFGDISKVKMEDNRIKFIIHFPDNDNNEEDKKLSIFLKEIFNCELPSECTLFY